MAPPQRFRVLRCCSCRLFQAHQEKKGLKWTCKACGEKQSFLRTYGEGSGADCRRHVQKLNLLQGQISEMSLRSLEEPGNIDEEENAGSRQAEHESAQEKPQSSENRWLKYLERDSEGLGMEGGGVCFKSPPLSRTEKPEPPFSTDLPRKRKWSQSSVRPPHSPDVHNLGDSEVTWEPQKDDAGLAGKVKGGSHKDGGTRELSVAQVGPPRLQGDQGAFCRSGGSSTSGPTGQSYIFQVGTIPSAAWKWPTCGHGALSGPAETSQASRGSTGGTGDPKGRAPQQATRCT